MRLQRTLDWVGATPFQRVVRAFDLASEFTKSRATVFEELDAVGDYWRTVMMNKAGAVRDEESARTLPMQSTLAESLRALVSVTECVSDLHKNVRPRLALEAMVMKWPINTREVT